MVEIEVAAKPVEKSRLDELHNDSEQKQNDCLSSSKCDLQANEKDNQGRDRNEIDLELVEQLRQMLKNDFENDVGDKACGGGKLRDKISHLHYEQLMDPESPYVCWRYLNHCQCRLDDALDLVKKALIWRKTNIEEYLNEEAFVKEFWHYSPFTFPGKDKQGNDILHVRGKDYKKADTIFKDTVFKFCTWLIFEWDREHQHDLDQIVAVFDVTDTGFRNMDTAFVSWLIGVLDFLPSRIAVIYVVGVPMILRPIVRMLISWLPERYRTILHCGTYEELVLKNIDTDQLPIEVGGTYDERKYRLAPVQAPWRIDSSKYSSEEMRKAIDYSIGSNVSADRREYLRKMQLESEAKGLVKEEVVVVT